MQKKIIRRPEVSADFLSHDLHPVLKRIYPSRGVRSHLELERGLDHLIPFQQLLGIEQAVACLAEAVMQQKKILIVGDFDADGATSSVVAVRALRSFGAEHVAYLVPNRFAFGYGLTPELVQVTKDNPPDIIVTVDNGIANHAGVMAAKALGIKVVITDHHLAGDTLPPADAIVNPNQPGDTFPSKSMAGVGVIFYVMLALRRYLAEQNAFATRPEPNMSRLLDLVALGTVADVVPLDHNNRILVQQGLRRIRAGQCVPGISALLEIAGRQQSRIAAADLGYAVAPRLNAAGRLEDMALGIECLLTDDMTIARQLAAQLNQLNEERRYIEQEMQEQAYRILKDLHPEKQQLPHGICLFDKEWHQGVIGILAGRIKDRLHRPVIAFAYGNGQELKGSARSIQGLHIRDVLADVATLHPELILKFGGHAMAAGLTIPADKFELFHEAFVNQVASKMTETMLNNNVLSDGELESQELSLELAEVLREAGPWGQAFAEPLFDGTFEVVDQRRVGEKHLKLVLAHKDRTLDAIAFNVDVKAWPNYHCRQVYIAYRLDVNEYRGKRSVQLIIEHLEEGSKICEE